MATITFPDIPNTDDRALHTYLTDMQVLLKKNLETLNGPSIEEVNSRISSSISSAIPRGVIVAWSGAIVDIPVGWALCNGENDTPDFRDKFIIASGATYAPGSTGGSSSVTVSGTIGATTLTTAQIPQHTHQFGFYTGAYGGDASGYLKPSSPDGFNFGRYRDSSIFGTTESAGSGGSHTHTLSTNSVSTLPPYYALAWIMKL